MGNNHLKHFPNKFRLTIITIDLDGKEGETVKEFSCGPSIKTVEAFKSHDCEPFLSGFCFVHKLKSAIIHKIEKL